VLQFIALVALDIELPVFNGGESSKLRGLISQAANKLGGEWASGRTNQGANRPKRGANLPEGEKARHRVGLCAMWLILRFHKS